MHFAHDGSKVAVANGYYVFLERGRFGVKKVLIVLGEESDSGLFHRT